jgi:elongation factor Ts
MAIDLKLVQELRNQTGLGMMDCRKALEQAGGDFDKAIELLRKKGASVAAKRSDKSTSEGFVASYIHPGDRVGVMVEINCETDFVARTEAVRKFGHDVCLHIAALKPLYLSSDQVDPNLITREREIAREQLAGSGKPEKIIEQIIEGKLNKVFSEICLLLQPFVKNDQITIDEALKELIAKTGENIRIRRFARFELGAN